MYLIYIGVFFIVCAIVLFIFISKRSKKCSNKTTAKIVRVNRLINQKKINNIEKTEEVYRPVLEYEVFGKKVLVNSNDMSKDKDEYKVGDEIEICYNPLKIEEYYFSNDKNYYLPIILTVIGFILIAIKIYIMYK